MEFIPISKPSITQKEITLVTDAVKSGWVSSLGKYIDLLEHRFADFCKSDYAIATSSGTTALHLALVSLGIKSSDEVIIPDLTFVATASAVKYIGAKVVLVDIDEDTLCLSPKAVEQAITTKTKAIIPVHLYGHPADMTKLKQIAKKHKILLIEDAAEAHGAKIKKQRVGAIGDAGIFSFYGNKIMTSGEGGMIITNNKNQYEKMKHLRDHAMSTKKRYWHTELGFNYRMTNLQAALGVAQLDRIESLISKKHRIMQWYKNELQCIPKIKLNFQAKWAESVYWMICLEIKDLQEKQRNKLMDNLKKRGIDSRPYFYPISSLPMYPNAPTPIAHKVSQRGLNLPSYFDLTKNQVRYICNNVKELIDEIS